MPDMSPLPERLPISWNKEFGFYGTVEQAAGNAVAIWSLAVRLISQETDEPVAVVGAFLDSRWGRKFADDVIAGMKTGRTAEDAILRVTHEWMNRPPNLRTKAEWNIPDGMSYLIGVMYAAAFVWEEL